MSYDFDTQTLSCHHKEAYGFRPLQSYFEQWDAMTDDEKQSEWDSLNDACRWGAERREAVEKESLLSFTGRLDAVLSLNGSLSTDDAIRWILQSEGFTTTDYMYGAEYCANHFALSYDNDFSDNFQRVCAAVVSTSDKKVA